MNNKGFHVRIADGRTYGVAADGKSDARQLVHGRMAQEGNDASVLGVDAIGAVSWDYGTTILY